ncbi:MAG: dihydrolipoyl dehydrogenase [Verrucomicrobia bacterium]|jgi:dihydrolipoamide dehydrogenase|nr:dihydrolipoyl dehydrogenase [Verrucomicrobiota bacterium]
MSTTKHDLVVIGAGPGGYVAAIRAAQLGLDVAVVERESALGGTCLRIGCIPSKALLESSERYWAARNEFAAHGVKMAGVKLDLTAMLKRKKRIVEDLTRGIEGLFRKNKITRYAGQGRLLGNGRIGVKAKDGMTELQAGVILIATGSTPAPLPGVELDGGHVGTSTDALSYATVPRHLVVIGAGYIGLELGSVWNRLGARVTVLEYLDRILPGMDAEIAAEAKKLFEKQGIKLRLKANVKSAGRKARQCVVEIEGQKRLTCDRVLVAVGRVPRTKDLGLEKVGIELDKKGYIPVREGFATSAKGVHAIGDVIGGAMLAHKAEEEGMAFAEQLVNGHGYVNYSTIPSVVYTHPEIASVGRTEEDLREAKTEYRKGVFPLRANGRALAMGATEGKVKVLAEARTDRILGVHVIGARAGDLIAEAVAAMNFGASAEDLARTCHAHPTLAESIREAALAVDDRSIHS